jgi:Flp pilus assembly protein TadG
MTQLGVSRLSGALSRGSAKWRKPRHAEHGTAAVELALVAPALFTFVFGIAETGRALWLQNALDYSVAEAARCAAINPTACGSANDIQNYAAARSGSGIAASVFSVTTPMPSCGNQVSASYPMALTIPFLTVSVTLTAQACYPS